MFLLFYFLLLGEGGIRSKLPRDLSVTESGKPNESCRFVVPSVLLHVRTVSEWSAHCCGNTRNVSPSPTIIITISKVKVDGNHFSLEKKIVSCYTHAMRDCRRLSFVWFIFSRPLWKIQGEKVLLRIIIFSDWIAWRLLCLKPYTLTSIHQVSLELCSYSSVFFSKCVWACDIRFRGLCVIMTSSFLFSYCWLSIDIDETLCVSKPNQWNLENVFFI